MFRLQVNCWRAALSTRQPRLSITKRFINRPNIKPLSKHKKMLKQKKSATIAQNKIHYREKRLKFEAEMQEVNVFSEEGAKHSDHPNILALNERVPPFMREIEHDIAKFIVTDWLPHFPRGSNMAKLTRDVLRHFETELSSISGVTQLTSRDLLPIVGELERSRRLYIRLGTKTGKFVLYHPNQYCGRKGIRPVALQAVAPPESTEDLPLNFSSLDLSDDAEQTGVPLTVPAKRVPTVEPESSDDEDNDTADSDEDEDKPDPLVIKRHYDPHLNWVRQISRGISNAELNALMCDDYDRVEDRQHVERERPDPTVFRGGGGEGFRC